MEHEDTAAAAEPIGGGLKRKASHDGHEEGEGEEGDDYNHKHKQSHNDDDDDGGHGSPKRARLNDGDDGDDDDDRSPKRSRLDDDDDHDHGHGHNHIHDHDDETARLKEQERRKQAAQEEKRRGKRLFGGLMSTLSQRSSPTATQQHKRRLEVERRQQERMQRQRAEDDERRVEKMARLRGVRAAEQIRFEEDVMRTQHAKRLAMARFLQTRCQPPVYFLPWRLTAEQEDVIREQIRRETDMIAKEVEEFGFRKAKHIERHGPPRVGTDITDPPVVTMTEEATATATATSTEANVHDESGDVLVEAEEDMVIY
ncbi:hypothetical protein ESCO_006019 [Escovopsis weberi]|uniref:Pinin/SDK/MemA protein domain-containing protein n=1 Tax=Escovopsis weberi TaxID=150374 RepID=A0A0M8N036_ESCWE|nr:hypothetical protein ESCO_006019 [Escovopsis weberi]